MLELKKRKKVNFMIERSLLEKINELVPAGKKSDFVNQSIKKALSQFAREKAFKEIREFAKKSKFKMSVEEINEAKNYGRE